ncbi:N,N-dimethylformamidase beta subunit family domain-containing protein [Geomesophilobacter sediminis]|uniref:DUF4082 domain-containing protein n=1 Tax=Geomesophilobacter sediminis TaxID=2798584 RepID=A0A8J7LVV5_9BACT|nr:DUF4082 domain-containing protein [Geomesophilobacter sediminis]MBJ6725984.1 DUF4082 domain-containing protein [Geomesophilobacter sediminis]
MNFNVPASSIRAVTACLVAACIFLAAPRPAAASCAAPANPIEGENCLVGTPQSTWDLPTKDAGDLTIQGFATDISVPAGGTVFFKLNTPARSWRLDIYRLGYYGGNGARMITSITGSTAQNQPACLSDPATGLVDCGNWSVSASWKVPASAVSGIYLAKATRTDTGGASHIVFVVRNDTRNSAIIFQSSDTTWHAYNNYGGNDFYQGPLCNGTYCRAYKVSYNRPFLTRSVEPQTWLFNAEYPMLRWLEANGFDVSYSTALDSDRNGTLLLNHQVFLSNGHDEYWSGNQRTNVEAARAAGVNLAFLSGNTIYWKTRWENSIDGTATPYRTLVCYKETWANAPIDPADPPTWTGTWRDPRFSPPADGGRPENLLTGSLTRFADSYLGGPITVPQADGKMRFWRNTSLATLGSGQTASLAPGTLADELDMDEDNGFRPAGLIRLSTTPVSTSTACLLDYGSTVGACSTTHNVTLYRDASGALVFSTGTYEWAWGLDANHDRTSLGSTTDVRMKQATVNLLADMGVQPATLQSGLVAASPSTDLTPPTSVITFPSSGLSFAPGSSVTVTGTATDSGGVVGGVEVSTDAGLTWHPASGRGSWSYVWTPASSGPTTILSRAVDDSGNLESPGTGVNVTVSGSTFASLWPSASPGVVDSGPDSPVELGVRFTSDVNGSIAGIRFYKATGNTGTHVGNLWAANGTLLASVTFSGETASGWQRATFSAPVAITANTPYIASYHTSTGHYSDDQFYFSGRGFDAVPLHAPADGSLGFNGVFAYGTGSSFPNQGWNASNYWVDVLFTPASTTAPTLVSLSVTPAAPTLLVGTTQQFTATGTYTDGSTQDLTSQVTWSTSNAAVATVAASGLATAVASGSSTITATSGTLRGSSTVTVAAQISIWSASTTPSVIDSGPDSAVELGVRFTSDVSGFITGIRFYKASTNTGTHTAHLWSGSGTLIASATFSGETASGWQQVNFAAPVAISAGTVYVASYHTNSGHYSDDQTYFATKGVDTPPLHALADGGSGSNGVFAYGSTSMFPASGWRSSNYWVDVVFHP